MNGLWINTGSNWFAPYKTQSASSGIPSTDRARSFPKSSWNSTRRLAFGNPSVLEPRTEIAPAAASAGAFENVTIPFVPGSNTWKNAGTRVVAGGRPRLKLWMTSTGTSDVNRATVGDKGRYISERGRPSSKPGANARARTCTAWFVNANTPGHGAELAVGGLPSVVYRTNVPAGTGPSFVEIVSRTSMGSVYVRLRGTRTTSGANPGPPGAFARRGVGVGRYPKAALPGMKPYETSARWGGYAGANAVATCPPGDTSARYSPLSANRKFAWSGAAAFVRFLPLAHTTAYPPGDTDNAGNTHFRRRVASSVNDQPANDTDRAPEL